MQEAAFMESVKRIRATDDRYDSEAYFFIREALGFTMQLLEKPQHGPGRHVSGRELVEGVRQYALQEFGPMTMKVLEEWGLVGTEDFGRIVFQLVEAGELGKTSEDKVEDFANCFDFRDAFEKPFEPLKPLSDAPSRPRRRPPAEGKGGAR